MGSKSKIEVNWEDDGEDFDKMFSHSDDDGAEQTESFSKMLAENSDDGEFDLDDQMPRIGEKVSAVISYIGPDSTDILLDYGSKSSAVIAKQELLDSEGVLRYNVGDKVTAFVVSINDSELVLSQTASTSASKKHALQSAYECKMPVKGKVVKVKKGGFEVQVSGRIAFCPLSQISNRFIKEPDVLIGQDFDFLITKFSDRDMVVSRSELLIEKAEDFLDQLQAAIDSEQQFSGEVVELKDFGAMVDLGLVVGMVHISQLSFASLAHPSEVLKEGERVNVKVLKVDRSNKRHPRISLSIKGTLNDPWEGLDQRYQRGETYRGKVVRLEKFGAFVELEAGVEGLVHISEMTWEKRILHPKEVVQVSEECLVKVLDIDLSQRRISLSLKHDSDNPWFELDRKYPVGAKLQGAVTRLKAFGAIVDLEQGLSGLVPVRSLQKAFGSGYRRKASPPATLDVKVVKIDHESKKILLGLEGEVEEEDSNQDFKEYLELMKSNAQKEQDKSGASGSHKKGSFGDILSRSLKGYEK